MNRHSNFLVSAKQTVKQSTAHEDEEYAPGNPQSDFSLTRK
jgi:hypothetical protein